MANYKKHNAEQKAKIALEALKENKTLSELSSEYGIASSQISTVGWFPLAGQSYCRLRDKFW